MHPHPTHGRYGSRAYRICLLFVFGYFVVIILAVVGRIAFIRDGTQKPDHIDHVSLGTDGACVIGLGRAAFVLKGIFFRISVLTICQDPSRSWFMTYR